MATLAVPKPTPTPTEPAPREPVRASQRQAIVSLGLPQFRGQARSWDQGNWSDRIGHPCSGTRRERTVFHVNVALRRRAAFSHPDKLRGTSREVSMKILASLLATAALVGGVNIATAQQSGSPTAPSGPMAGGSSPNATQAVRGTQRIETTGQTKKTKKGAKKSPSPPPGSGSPTAPSGPGAGGASPPSR